jgi:hypothetical protein
MVAVSTVVRPFSSSWGLSNMKVSQSHRITVTFTAIEVRDILVAHIQKSIPEAKKMKVSDSDINEGNESSYIELEA